MSYPPVIVVDETDTETGLAMLAEVWEKGLYHRIVRIMAEDGQGRILLQKRSANMVLFPGCWDNSAAGHVDEGMDYASAAAQEVAEELGLPDVNLERIGYYFSEDVYEGKQMRQFNTVYRLILHQTPVTQDEHEVDTFEWVSIEEAKLIAREYPQTMTFGLRHVLEKLY